MGEVTLDKHAYEELIKEDIELVEIYIPQERFMRNHIIKVLEWSVTQLYPDPKNDGSINEIMRSLDSSSREFQEYLSRLAKWLKSEDGQKTVADGQKHINHIEEIIQNMKNIRSEGQTEPYSNTENK